MVLPCFPLRFSWAAARGGAMWVAWFLLLGISSLEGFDGENGGLGCQRLRQIVLGISDVQCCLMWFSIVYEKQSCDAWPMASLSYGGLLSLTLGTSDTQHCFHTGNRHKSEKLGNTDVFRFVWHSNLDMVWWFPEMGVPPNHPFEIIWLGFSIINFINHPFWGSHF